MQISNSSEPIFVDLANDSRSMSQVLYPARRIEHSQRTKLVRFNYHIEPLLQTVRKIW